MNLKDRDSGAIVTVRDGDRTRSLSYQNCAPQTAVKAAVDWIRVHNEAGANWRIVCISNPVTIMRDLQGSRQSEERARGLVLPEITMLARAGGSDLWGGK